jgi:hypothetical protein
LRQATPPKMTIPTLHIQATECSVLSFLRAPIAKAAMCTNAVNAIRRKSSPTSRFSSHDVSARWPDTPSPPSKRQGTRTIKLAKQLTGRNSIEQHSIGFSIRRRTTVNKATSTANPVTAQPMPGYHISEAQHTAAAVVPTSNARKLKRGTGGLGMVDFSSESAVMVVR